MQLVSILGVVAESSVLTYGDGGIQLDGKGLVEVSMHLPVIVCGELGCFFTLRSLERQLSRRGSDVGNWRRREKGGTGKEEVRREITYEGLS